MDCITSTKISNELYSRLCYLGIIESESVRNDNVGESDYSKHTIQPWSIWLDYDLNAFDADIIKRVLRTKDGESEITKYLKIIHICKERIRQIQQSINVEQNEVKLE